MGKRTGMPDTQDVEARMKRLFLLMAMFVIAAVVSAEDAVPQELKRMVRFFSDAKDLGWASPVNDGSDFLTAGHIEGSNAIWTTQSGTMGRARLVWRDKDTDLALWHDDSSPKLPTLKFADVMPESGDAVYSIGYIFPGAVPVSIRGHWLGIDKQRDAQIDEWGIPGCSGSALLNAKGEMVGVVIAGWNAITDGQDYKPSAENVHILYHRSNFRPVVIVRPLSGVPEHK